MHREAVRIACRRRWELDLGEDLIGRDAPRAHEALKIRTVREAVRGESLVEPLGLERFTIGRWPREEILGLLLAYTRKTESAGRVTRPRSVVGSVLEARVDRDRR